MSLHDFEKLGVFYLGRQYDLRRNAVEPDLLLYDSKDLTTHAVCVGMTGSGKTGLCLSLLEEAAIDNIPVLAIDPKGDLGNLMLTFPDLKPEDFRPWIDESEATRNGMKPDQFSTQVADTWRKGLAEWGQDGRRIERFRSAVDTTIYTPASNAGIPLAVLRSFDVPSAGMSPDSDEWRGRISSSVSGLLALLRIDADPIRSREHILLSNLLDRAWRSGRSLDIGGMIQGIQSPPFDKVGFLDLESFFPSNDRFAFSMQLNNLAASPSFSSWMSGDPIDIKRLLYTPAGRPRLSIVSIAHLSEAERMFFVTILLNEVLSWIRTQPGTSSLRAILYMDEVFGYFPPTANPPSKTPMLTLLKQARAYGLGVVLATQNPVDLDYKGLSNTGTWFLGRLQTERDKARVLEGLEGASAATGTEFNRSQMEETLARLGKRVFLMHNVHDDQPVVFQTRWALSYLRGPMTRDQIEVLMADRKQQFESESPAGSAPAQRTPPPVTDTKSQSASETSDRPIVPVEANECFAWSSRRSAHTGRLVYRPALLSLARLHYVRSTYGVDDWLPVSLLYHIRDEDTEQIWEQAEPLGDEGLALENTPQDGVPFTSLPAAYTNKQTYSRIQSRLKEFLYREKSLTIWRCATPKLYSSAGEAEDDFRIRLQQAANEERDVTLEKIRKRYATKLQSLQDQIRRAEERVDREKAQYRSQQFQTAVTWGSTIVGALLGRKLASRTNVSSAGTAMRAAGRTARERTDIGRAEENVESLQQKLADLENELAEELEKIEESFRADQLELEELQVRPRKSDINVEKLSLVWIPWSIDEHGIAEIAAELA